MKKTLSFYISVFLCITAGAHECIAAPSVNLRSGTSSPRTVIDFNTRWLFKTGDLPNGAAVTLNETSFTPVCLPHANTIVPHRGFDMKIFRNVSWYRRHFTPPPECRERRFILDFQGASQITEVFVNGTAVGIHRGAYTPFSFDITDHLSFGKDNVIAVRVDSRKHREIPPEGQAIDFMLFGGITRDVSMIITSPLHVDWIFASRDSIMKNRVNIRSRIINCDTVGRECIIETRIIDTTGATVAFGSASGTVEAASSLEVAYTTTPIDRIREWDIDTPYLYTVRTRIQIDSVAVDEYSEKTGLRSFSFSRADGKFYLNGRPVWLSGLNRHETFPFIGRAAANRLQAADADILKYELGCTIVRCSHYPQDPEFLSRCDEIGLLVLEEIPGWGYVGDSAWQAITLRNVEEMVVRDRNHPSIISFGVRINQSHDFNDFYRETNRLSRTLDPTRPTHGVRLKGRYAPENYLEDVWTHNFIIPEGKPQHLPWLITESFGINCQVHSWDNEEKLIRILLRFAEVMDSVAANPYICGQIGWCAFDYNSGYPTADNGVCYYGAMDLYRIPKHAGMFLKSQGDPATVGPVVYIAHTWNRKLSPNDVWVASNCDKVELFIGKKSLGIKKPDRFPSLPHPMAVWKGIPFKPGMLRAVGYCSDTIAAVHTRKTSKGPVTLKMIPDATQLIEGGDMTRVVVLAVDRYGQTSSAPNTIVELAVTGAAAFVGQHLIALEDGKTAFFVKTKAGETGPVTCRAKARGLAPAVVKMAVQSAPENLTDCRIQR
ncbi:MAG: DUF4982 domain-containing protein [Chitinispirillaceae bacterium]|nr:DUF4982 domain-containing protein [Chitinispirillaceae bacterium]